MQRTRRIVLAVVLSSGVSAMACSEGGDESTAEVEEREREEWPSVPDGPDIGRPPDTMGERQATKRAEVATQHLRATLETRLMAAMAEGPEAAVRACAAEAQELTRRAADERGARVGRSSLKLRNPGNGGPAWVTAWLEARGERAAEGVTPDVGIAGDTRVARFVGPIGMEGPCLMCHGDPEGIPEDVRSLLSERYPNDAATGYAVGDLRGAIWAEVPVGAGDAE